MQSFDRAEPARATDLIAEIRAYDAKLKDNAKDMADLVAQAGSTLTDTVGIGPVTAGRLLSRTGRPNRFPTAAAFANYAGAAPIEIASADRARHRLSRRGDRQLNSALHIIAVTQIRTAGSPGRTYYSSKIAEGKTPREAKRCLIGGVWGSAAPRQRVVASRWASGDGLVAAPQ